jgi:hypothetical protein
MVNEMTHSNETRLLDRRDETVLSLAAFLIPLAALAAMAL